MTPPDQPPSSDLGHDPDEASRGSPDEPQTSDAAPGPEHARQDEYPDFEERAFDEGDMEALRLEQQRAEEQRANERESLRRALRDLEAAEQRVKRNAERVYEEARGSLVRELFPVLDNLDRSIEAARARGDTALLQGVQMIRKQLDEVLARYGAERIDASGGPFDPNVQEAVTAIHVDDPGQDKTVLEQLAPGYRFGDQLLRPAKVVVGVRS